jgi:quercetin dioxygenase-like cupin family protein
VKIVSAAELAAMSADVPAELGVLRPDWLEGPFTSDRLDVGLVTMSPGAATPPHTHVGGQVLVVTAGRGFIETGGHRSTIERGDVIICPPGELHVHGALGEQPLAHLTVTTGGYTFPEPSEK